MKQHFCLIVVLLLIFLGAPALAVVPAGEIAPDFEAVDLQGKVIKLSDFRGQALLIEMGATWCPTCNEQAHQIDSIRPFLSKKGITYMSVFLADSPESVNEYLKNEKLAPPDQILIDSGDARRSYGVFTIPRLILIDREFKIVFDGMTLDAQSLKTKINKSLN